MTRDPRVDAYIDRAASFAQPILRHVRERVHAVVPDVQETIKWNMPAYTRAGAILVITAAFKAHAALNFWRGKEIAGGHDSVGAMGQFGKLRSIADLPPPGELDRLIRDAAERAGLTAPRRPRSADRPAAAMHPEFAAALEAEPRAKGHFERLPPSHRREYLDWIATAKRDETRARRIATAVEWLREGKSQNWRYEARR